jgi:hypothetical protein
MTSESDQPLVLPSPDAAITIAAAVLGGSIGAQHLAALVANTSRSAPPTTTTTSTSSGPRRADGFAAHTPAVGRR